MSIRNAKSLSAASLACVLMLGGAECVARRVLAADPAAAGHEADVREDKGQAPPVSDVFLVFDQGLALLGPDGTQLERLEPITSASGAFSPDGRWVASSRLRPANSPEGYLTRELVIQSRVQPGERTIVPLIWGGPESVCLPFWSSDSQRILVFESGMNSSNSRGRSYRVYDRATGSLTAVKLSTKWLPSGWSADGKRVLTTLNTGNLAHRSAWVNIDGTGDPEPITPEDFLVGRPRLSPDHRRLLCLMAPRPTKGEEQHSSQLYVFDLATKTWTVVGRPGYTFGFCWSSDGSKIAYTWQAPIRNPSDVRERKTYLVTCDPDGANRKIVTMRTRMLGEDPREREDPSIFFMVFDWWRQAGKTTPR